MNFTPVAPRKEPSANMTEDHGYSPLQILMQWDVEVFNSKDDEFNHCTLMENVNLWNLDSLTVFVVKTHL